jgi:hypothetical protein
VLAPEGLKWIHEDEELRVPTQAWVHRARYVAPRGRKPAEELHGTEGCPGRSSTRAWHPAASGRRRAEVGRGGRRASVSGLTDGSGGHQERTRQHWRKPVYIGIGTVVLVVLIIILLIILF